MRRALVILSAACALFSNAVALTPLPPPDVTPLPQPETSRFTPSKHRVYPKVRGDTVLGYHLKRLSEADTEAEASYPHPYEPVMDAGIGMLPLPEKLILSPRKLSLADAIALALRNNPNVKIAEMQRILDKFGMEVSIHNNYGIQWNALTFSPTIINKGAPTWATTGGFSVKTPTGTTFSLAQTNNLLGGLGSTVLTMTQPLMQNFGFAYNRIIYENALDNEKIARLAFKNSVISVVQTVITNYHALVQQYDSLDEDKKSFARQAQGVAQTKLQVAIGKMSQSDFLQQEQNLESTRLSVVQQEDTLRTAYFTFLSSLGLIPTAKLTIDRRISVGREKVPPLKKCIQLALIHNVSYRTALINLDVTKRTLISANNARKWQLNMVSTVTEGSQRTATGSPIANISTNPSLAFNLSIPIDQIQLKQAVVTAKVNIEGAKLTLEQDKENLVLGIMNQWDSIHNQYEQIKVAEVALALQEKTLQNAKLKLKYGKSSVFEVNTLETGLLTQEVALVSTKISYLNSITALYKTMGIILERWNIKLRY